MTKNVIRTDLTVYTKGMLVFPNEPSRDPYFTTGVLEAILHKMGDENEPVVVVFQGQLELPLSASSVEQEFRAQEKQIAEHGLREIALNRLADALAEGLPDGVHVNIANHDGYLMISPASGTTALDKRIQVIVTSLGLGESEEEAADDSLFDVDYYEEVHTSEAIEAGRNLRLGSALAVLHALVMATLVY